MNRKGGKRTAPIPAGGDGMGDCGLYRCAKCGGTFAVMPAVLTNGSTRVTAPLGTIDLLRIAHDIFGLCTPVTVREFHSVSSLRDSEIIIAQRRVCNKLPPRINITPT